MGLRFWNLDRRDGAGRRISGQRADGHHSGIGNIRFIAGLFAFRRANMLVATAFCSFGAFNVLTAVFFALQAHGVLTTTGDPMMVQGFVLLSSH